MIWLLSPNLILYFLFTDKQDNISIPYKYTNPSPLSPKDKINGPINETFVLNCPQCASHFNSSQLLQQHLQNEHNVSDYAGVNTKHFHNGSASGMEIIEEQEMHENEEDEMVMIMDGENEDGNEDNDYEGSQDINGQDIPYSDGQNVVSTVSILFWIL